MVFGLLLWKLLVFKKKSYRRRVYLDEEGGEELSLRSFRASTPIIRGYDARRTYETDQPRQRRFGFLQWFSKSKPVEIPKVDPRFTIAEDSPLLDPSRTEATIENARKRAQQASVNLKEELEEAEKRRQEEHDRAKSFKTFKPEDEAWTNQLTPKQARLLAQQRSEKLLRDADKIAVAGPLDISLSTSEEL